MNIHCMNLTKLGWKLTSWVRTRNLFHQFLTDYFRVSAYFWLVIGTLDPLIRFNLCLRSGVMRLCSVMVSSKRSQVAFMLVIEHSINNIIFIVYKLLCCFSYQIGSFNTLRNFCFHSYFENLNSKQALFVILKL